MKATKACAMESTNDCIVDKRLKTELSVSEKIHIYFLMAYIKANSNSNIKW